MNAIQAERAMLPALVSAAATSIDRLIIQNGIAQGLIPSVLDVKPEHSRDIDIVWLRFRAACARAEARLIPEMAGYLRHRAWAADLEANARENSLEIHRRIA